MLKTSRLGDPAPRFSKPCYRLWEDGSDYLAEIFFCGAGISRRTTAHIILTAGRAAIRTPSRRLRQACSLIYPHRTPKTSADELLLCELVWRCAVVSRSNCT
jgi:hypothetical protein